MIEKLTCCLAHPMTALRTLRDKINDVITAHNELVNKVDNLPAGGGGESTPGPVVASTVCLCSMQAVQDINTGEYTFSGMDKTFSEMYTTYTTGGLLWLRLFLSDSETGNQIFTHECFLIMLMDDGGMKGFIFGPSSGQELSVLILESGDVMILPQKMV